MHVINQTVGDAISDLLLVETVLHSRGWSIADWSAAYTDLPNRQLKVSVKVSPMVAARPGGGFVMTGRLLDLKG